MKRGFNLLICSLLKPLFSGETGIRTLDTRRYNGFRDRPDRPLRHLSSGATMHFRTFERANIQRNFKLQKKSDPFFTFFILQILLLCKLTSPSQVLHRAQNGGQGAQESLIELRGLGGLGELGSPCKPRELSKLSKLSELTLWVCGAYMAYRPYSLNSLSSLSSLTSPRPHTLSCTSSSAPNRLL